jgi:CDGSH-type Zn-finger protein/uncharacterized Fe-S cluster protein YjdI
LAQRTYSNDAITVLWDSKRCIHTGICLMGLPAVFDTQRRPWVEIDAAAADEVADVVSRCPTGALRFERNDGEPGEEPRRPTVVIPIENGPLLVAGDLLVQTPDGEEITHEARLTLCRCGKTRNQPFCDNSHLRRGWESGDSAGEPGKEPPPPREGATEAATTVVPLQDGSLEMRGDIVMCDPAGRPVKRAGKVRLCRCGQSGTKPYCDASHERVGFESRDPAAPRDRLEAETPAAFTPNPKVPDPREAGDT